MHPALSHSTTTVRLLPTPLVQNFMHSHLYNIQLPTHSSTMQAIHSALSSADQEETGAWTCMTLSQCNQQCSSTSTTLQDSVTGHSAAYHLLAIPQVSQAICYLGRFKDWGFKDEAAYHQLAALQPPQARAAAHWPSDALCCTGRHLWGCLLHPVCNPHSTHGKSLYDAQQ